jgi:hypothetical protein
MKKIEGGFFEKNEIDAKLEIVSVSESESTYSGFKIKRKKVNDYYIPMTYRLKASTIEQIRIQSKQADMGVAEYLQKVLDMVLDRIEIE